MYPRVFKLGSFPLLGLLAASTIWASTVELTAVKTFPLPFGSYDNVVGINDNGDIAGNGNLSNLPFNPPGNEMGFLIPGDGGPPIQIGHSAAQYTYVSGINNQRTLVGFYLGNDNVIHGFTYSNGAFTPVIAGPLTFASGINNNGDITGFFSTDGAGTGFLIKNGVETTFSVPGFPFDTYPTAVNDSDQVVGYFNSATQGFIRNADGSFDTFNFAAESINDAGIIVGSGAGSDDNSIGYLRIDGVSYPYIYPGAAETYLGGINNLDEVVGIAESSSSSANNAEVIFEGKLEVVNTPEPPTLFFCAYALGALLVLAWRRRRRLRS